MNQKNPLFELSENLSHPVNAAGDATDDYEGRIPIRVMSIHVAQQQVSIAIHIGERSSFLDFLHCRKPAFLLHDYFSF